MSTRVLKTRKDTFPRRRLLLRPVRLVGSAQFWKSLAFLWLNLPLGFVYFTVLVTLLFLGAGTAPIGVGLVLLAFAPPLILFGAQCERWRVAIFLDNAAQSSQDTAPPSFALLFQGLREFGRQPFGSLGKLLQQSWARAGELATWRSLLYLLLIYPLGTLEIWGGSQLAVFTIRLALAVFDWVVPGKHRTAEIYQTLFGIHVDSAPTALLFTFVAILSLVAGVYLVVSLAGMHRALAGRLLWPSAAERQAHLEARIRALDESRANVVTAAFLERQRIERDLHDGAQQRLVALAMDLGMAREKLATQPEVAQELITQAHEEAKRALAELRDLVRGIHPAVLTDRGLDPALSALAARCPVPVTVTIDLPERLPDAVESTAYFVAAEALTNIAKHSGATQATVEVCREEASLHLDICDDGRGGADLKRGTGLKGIADRVAALDGQFSLTSPVGGPTRLHVELPLP